MIANALTTSLPVAPAAAASGAPPASTDGGDAHPFARLLDDASSSAGPAGTDKTGGPRAASTAKAPTAKERGKERVDSKGPRPADPATTQQAEPADGPIERPGAPEGAASQPEDATAAPAADAAALLATLPPLPQRPHPGGAGGTVRSASGSGTLPTGGTRGGSETDPVLTPPDLGDARDTRNAVRGSAAASFGEALREAGKTPAAETDRKAAAAEQSALPLPAQTATATAVSASAPAEARIAATPGSADFASQLGAQLSTFVRDGIEHAKLELHPLELGPVTVQIQIDGSAAQVDLAAEQAPTRAALEQALPELAGSLREAGLTLTGGGVFEQPRQPNETGGRGAGSTRDGGGPRSERDPARRESVTTQPVAAPRRRGVVDLVA